MPEHERIARALLGSLIAIRTTAEVKGYDPERIGTMLNAAIELYSQALDLPTDHSQQTRLIEENIDWLHRLANE